ncbi:uncharacterized protein LOC129956631 [Argiope bruennichi]|uniref:uncharacterized protein LOC129956631 n=1 Tax=Argiope bruennichi TaxID=94029 RepID=UPI002495064B|nr:uncharacterized protein LOC129956631 [Argiope bruennichi]
MPLICCVPNCNGNYRNGPRVSVFAFPKNEELKKKWLSAIHREGFYPTQHSRVCELHFKKNDIERETSLFDSKSGKLLSAPLKYPRLVIGAIPSQMPNCAAYMSSSTFHRENPEIKKMKLEQQYVEKALQESIIEKKKYDETREFKNLEELKQRISLVNLKNFWNVIHKENKILFVNIEVSSGPEIALSVVINDVLEVSAFVGKTNEMHVKPYFDYKGGNISGFSYNSENAATSVVTFMINSISSSYKDVVHILPSRHPVALRKGLNPYEIANLLRELSENESDGGKLSCSNLDSDEDIRLHESDCKESEESADEIDNSSC